MAALARLVEVAQGRSPADPVLAGAPVLDVVTGALIEGDVAILGDRIAGIGGTHEGPRRDLSG